MGLAVSFFSGYVRLAVSFFIRKCLGVSIFCKTKPISEKKLILTLPIVWIPQKATYRNIIWRQKKAVILVVLEYNSGISSSS